MAKPITKEPAPERPSEGSSAIVDKLYQQGQQAVDQALTMLKGYLPAQAPNPSATLEAAPPVAPKPTASPESNIVVPPRAPVAPSATPPPVPPPATSPAGSSAPQKPKEEGALQQGLEYIKRMPHEAVLAIAGVTAAAWFFSQPNADDGWMKSSLRTLVRYSGLALLGTWAWQKYGDELTQMMGGQAPLKERPKTRPSERAAPTGFPAPNEVAKKTGIEVEQVKTGQCLLWVDDDAYEIQKTLSRLQSFVRQGDVYVLSGTALNIPGKAYFSAAELERVGQVLRAGPRKPSQDLEVVGTIKKADFPEETWEAVLPFVQRDKRNTKINENPEEWKVHTSLSFTFIPSAQ